MIEWFIAPQAQYLLSLLAATKDPALVTSTTDPATGAEDTRTRPGHTSDKPMDIDDTANQTDNLVSSGSGIHKSAICMESTTFISPFNSNSSNSSGESSSASTAPTDISADSKSSTTSKVILPVEAADHNDGEDSEDDVEEDVMEPAFVHWAGCHCVAENGTSLEDVGPCVQPLLGASQLWEGLWGTVHDMEEDVMEPAFIHWAGCHCVAGNGTSLEDVGPCVQPLLGASQLWEGLWGTVHDETD
ncbi:hypothetical protein B0H10DRAFT_285266 [Mycena sp. CBHHK59/15]|nr:hypothetical protein B0H10DRAFT_285266 [Mycena sp. CBHHK59/15]